MAESSDLDSAVAQGGAYEVIRARLDAQAADIRQHTEQLNQARIQEFGQASLDVLGRVRVRTEHNCIARDIVPVGDLLLFGYNVFIGLKKATSVADVFSLYRLDQQDGQYQLAEQPLDGSFLADPGFVKDFSELYQYYKETRLIQLKVQNQQLFAVFQIGQKLSDIRVFQWQITPDGQVNYTDNRGERAIKKAASHDFVWQSTSRDDHISGTHPHVNILDSLFVDTLGGQLTIKVEDNTEDGLGIYQEPVEDNTQSLADADIDYAQVGSLILLKIRPYREKQHRYLVYNPRNQQVKRIDAIGDACLSLPEDHGLIFPGGYYLQNGESKAFPDQLPGLAFKRRISSPNGEDVLYIFYEPDSGLAGLYSYNLISKQLQNPIYAHGYSIFADGTAVLFNAEDEATRIHPMQVWQTPYFSDEFAASQPTNDSFYSRIGNKELVRAISDLTSLCRDLADPSPSRALYEALIKTSKNLFDSYHWLDDPSLEGLHTPLTQLASTAELVIDEFEKVQQIRRQAEQAIAQASEQQQSILKQIDPTQWQSPEPFITSLDALRQQRGHLISLREQRYIDLQALDQLDEQCQHTFDQLSQNTVTFLTSENALSPYQQEIAQLQNQTQQVELVVEITPLLERLDALSEGLDLLSEVLNSLQVEDATQRTQIIDDISQVYAQLNQAKAKARQRKNDLGSGEASAEFAAQFRLFSQSINSALALADTPQKTDDALARMLLQLEELESKFSEHERFLADILSKREELHQAFEGRKQTLLEQQQRRAQSLSNAAGRILAGVLRRSGSFTSNDQLNSYFAADPMLLKLGELIEQLRELDDQVKADDLSAQLKAAKEQAIRRLRDQQDIFEDGGSLIKLGKHRFSVNRQKLELTLLPREDRLYRHLIGTDYFERVNHDQLNALQAYWQQDLPSENPQVSRAEYLAYLVLQDAEQQQNGLSIDTLGELCAQPTSLLKTLQTYVSERYQEGYQKGIHDHDAARILQALLPVYQQAGLLRYTPQARALAMLFMRFAASEQQGKLWQLHAHSAAQLAATFGSQQGFTSLQQQLEPLIERFVSEQQLPLTQQVHQAADYLAQALASQPFTLLASQGAREVHKHLQQALEQADRHGDFTQQLNALRLAQAPLLQPWQLLLAWLSASSKPQQQHYLAEAAAILLCDDKLTFENSSLTLDIQVTNLLSEHPLIEQGLLNINLDSYLNKLQHFVRVDVLNYQRYQQLRQQQMQHSRGQLQLDSFTAKPLSSFVRNRLIDEVYLPIIGDNLAKQMGSAGDKKRTDLMGLLLLISPPGYGKTTLMEYVADRLGLVFMKINCPSLGHDVMSLDPATAPNATAAQELEKLNLGLEMGSNVMLYLDDIQHTHPEFLQKFIALCDGTRRIEGVWQGQSKTYDMRGKKFCVVMAGNPYTESGETFKVPDMLANRADIYNLGDVLGGKERQFATSYIENSLTSNPVLAPLALRDMQDLYRFMQMAAGETVANNDFSHPYSGAEINEIVAVLKHLLRIQQVILKVNLQYIESAATADDYRQEPPFKLQGSYRNMNKMAEKVSAVLNEQELQQLIEEHYNSEAQTLTSGAEENLLKLAQLRGDMSESQQARWQQICAAYSDKKRLQTQGDSQQQGLLQLSKMADTLGEIRDDMLQSDTGDLIRPINRVAAAMHLLSKVWSGEDKDIEQSNSRKKPKAAATNKTNKQE